MLNYLKCRFEKNNCVSLKIYNENVTLCSVKPDMVFFITVRVFGFHRRFGSPPDNTILFLGISAG